jgi:GNAT superfamily N-acetyltransferase
VIVRFRNAESESERKFVISSWLDATRTSHHESLIAVDDWLTAMWPHREKLMARPGMRTILAYEKHDRDFLYGFIVADPTEQRIPNKDGLVLWYPALVVYVFVKQNYRKEGIARRLCEAAGVDLSKPFVFASGSAHSSLASRFPLAILNPLAARFPKQPRPPDRIAESIQIERTIRRRRPKAEETP